MNTNWSTPKTNLIAGMLDLRNALQYGKNAILIKARNEDCEHPIRDKDYTMDFRNYKFSIGYLTTRQSILEDQTLSEFEKHLSLNYVTCYGTEDAVKQYYETGICSADNFKGMGKSHLVNVKDMVEFLIKNNENERATMLSQQYLTLENANQRHFYDRYIIGNQWKIKKFKRKLWVVSLLYDNQPKPKISFAIKLLNVLLYPIKYLPKKSVLYMETYRVISFRLGSITSGYNIDIQIPKKFNWWD